MEYEVRTVKNILLKRYPSIVYVKQRFDTREKVILSIGVLDHITFNELSNLKIYPIVGDQPDESRIIILDVEFIM